MPQSVRAVVVDPSPSEGLAMRPVEIAPTSRDARQSTEPRDRWTRDPT